MASISEVAAIVNSVGVAGEQARRSVEKAIEDIEVAIRSLPALGDGSKPKMMLAMYKRALAECHDVTGHINIAHDVGQALIAELHG